MNTPRAVMLKAVADVSVRASGLITLPVLAAYAGVQGYGAYGQLNAIVALVVPFASLGIASAVIRFVAGEEWTAALRRRLVRVGFAILGSGGALAIAMALGAPQVNDLFLQWSDGAELLRWGSLFILLGTAQTFLLEVMRARSWLTGFSLLQVCDAALTVAAIALLLPAGHDIVDVVKVSAAARLGLLGATVLLIARRPIAAARGPKRDLPIAPMIRFGLPFTVAGLGLYLMNLGDRLVIGHFMGADDLGRYGAVYSLSALMLLVSAPLFLPAYPRFMRGVLRGDVATVSSDISLFHRFLSLGLFPVAGYLIVMIPPVLERVGGGGFHVGRLLVALVVAGIVVDQWNGLAHYLLPAYERTVFVQNVWLGCGLLNALLNVVIVPRFGLNGAGAVTLFTFILLDGILFAAACRHVDLRRDYQHVLSVKSVGAAALAAVLATWALSSIGHDWQGLTAATLVFFMVYVVALAMARELHRSDVAMVTRAFRGQASGSATPTSS